MSLNKHESLISIVIPCYNEAGNLYEAHKQVVKQMKKIGYDYEIYFVNDGSKDNSSQILEELAQKDPHVHAVELTRNFGKEITLTAGLHRTRGDAIIMLDADLQHPPRYIPKFLEKWQAGADVVIGVRDAEGTENLFKIVSSKLFYFLINRISEIEIIPKATDFRLLDRQVVDAFNQMTERDRMTRGLIDWLGFKRDTVHFKADERHHGTATYSTAKLFKLAMDSFVSMSLFPLRLSGYAGVIIMGVSGPLGLFMYVDKYLMDNSFDFTGPASLGVLLVFLVGVILANFGLIALYIATIHSEVRNRPLYVVRKPRKK